MIGAILVMLLDFLLLFLARKETVEEGWNASKWMQPFYKGASLLYELVKPRIPSYFIRIEEFLGRLQPGKKRVSAEKEYFVKKTALVLLVLFLGMGMVLILSLSENSNSSLIDGKRIARNGENEKDFQVLLDAQMDKDVFEDIEISVLQKQYSEEAFYEMMPEFETALEKEFLQENESLDYIAHDVSFPTKVSGYPFQVEWTFTNYDLFDYEGKLQEEIPEQGTIASFTATIKYLEYQVEYTFCGNIYPKEKTESELIREALVSKLQEYSNKSLQEDYFELPTDIDGIKVTWTEKKTENTILFFLLILIAAGGIFFGQDKDLSKKLEQRKEQMLQDYPEIVSKITLFVGAGMPVRSAFVRVAQEYREKKKDNGNFRYAYEEILMTVNEMESGVEEITAYRNFAARCHVQKYVKFGALLEQNARVGGRGFLDTLNEEVKDSFEDRRHMAERLGEQAGTKLLIPMFMMLLIVMVMIMVPAFTSM